MTKPEPRDIPVFILCGGLGTRLGDGAGSGPKPMVEIGDRPLLAHLMHSYARWGFRRFILCTGYRHEIVSNYFLNYNTLIHDFTVDLGQYEVSYHQRSKPVDWEITIAHTGIDTMTGGRIARAAARYLGDSEHFAVTYGDGLTDADLGAEWRFHRAHAATATVLAVNPVSQYGRLMAEPDGTGRFDEKPRLDNSWINGGFFFFRRKFLDYLRPDKDCVMEEEPLRKLGEDRGLRLFLHDGFWKAVDTTKDRDHLRSIYARGHAPWLDREEHAQA